jgi:hypothetical protein
VEYAITALSFMVLAICLCIGIHDEYRHRSPILLFHIALIAVYLVPTAVSFTSPNHHAMHTILMSNFLAALYTATFATVRVATRHIYKPKELIIRIASEPPTILMWVSLVLLTLSLAFFIRGLGITSISTALTLGWWDIIQSGSPLVLIGTYLSYGAAATLLLTFSKSSSLTYQIQAGTVCAVYLAFAVFVLKVRSYLLLLLVPAFLHYVYSAGRGRILKSLTYGLIIIFVFILTRAVRHAENLEDFLTASYFEFFASALEGAETSLADAFHYFVSIDNAHPGFSQNSTMIRILSIPFAPFFESARTTEFSYIMHNAYYGSDSGTGLSMHPTAYGDAFANLGVIGMPIYGACLALYFWLLESLGSASKSPNFEPFVFSILAVASLSFARGAVYNAFMFSFLPFIFLALTMAMLHYFMRIRLSPIR